MRGHSANELDHVASILQSDASTVLITGVRVAIHDLTGRRLEQAQIEAAETSHMILFRYPDALGLSTSCYISCEGVTYIVDYFADAAHTEPPRAPRHNMWLEVYCHVEGSITVS